MKNFTFRLLALTGLGILSSALSVQAQPGSGIRLGETLLLIPELSASYNWNNNVNVRRRALDEGGERLDENEGDTYVSGQVSLSLRHYNRSTQTSAKAWYNVQNYAEFTELDEPSYGGNLSWFWARPGAETTLRTELSHQIAVDKTEQTVGFVGDSLQTEELENIGERVQREETRAQVTVDQALIKDMRGNVSYSYADYAYTNDRYNDRVSQSVNAEANHQTTEKTQPYFRLGYAWDDDQGFDGYAEKPYFLLGVRHKPTDKLNFDVAGGYETYTRTPNEGVDAGTELEDSGIKWTLSVKYAATHKTRFSLNGRNGYSSVASEGSSSRKENSVSLAMDHQTTRQLTQRLSVAWREDDYLSLFPARGGLYDELKETWWFQYRIDYKTVRPWLSVYAQISYEDGSSKVPGDSYTEAEATVGLKARY